MRSTWIAKASYILIPIYVYMHLNWNYINTSKDMGKILASNVYHVVMIHAYLL